MNISNIYNNEKLSYDERYKVDEEINAIKIHSRDAKSATFAPIDKMDHYDCEHSNKGETIAENDPQRVF